MSNETQERFHFYFSTEQEGGYTSIISQSSVFNK